MDETQQSSQPRSSLSHPWGCGGDEPVAGFGETGHSMALQNVEIVRLMWAGLNEEGTSWLELFDERYEIRNPAEFPVPGRIGGTTGRANGLGLATLLTDDLAPFTRVGLLPDERAE